MRSVGSPTAMALQTSMKPTISMLGLTMGICLQIVYSKNGTMLPRYLVCEWKIVDFQALLIVMIELIQDHRFEEVVMQAWLYLPVQGGHELRDGPRDPSTGEILRPPVPKYRAPAPTDPSVFRPRDSRGPCGTRSNQTGPAIHVVNRTRPSPYISQDGTLIQPFPGASIAVHNYCNNVDVPLAPHTSPYVTNLDLYQQRPGQFSPSEHDESELSDWSRTLRNTPEPSHSSRNSSVSAIFSASSTSNVYTPTHSRNESESSYTFQDSASDEGCQVIIQNVGADETHDQLSQLLDQRMPRYVQHEEPKRGEDNKWSVKFSKEEDAEEAKEQLDNLVFKGRMLKVDLSHGGSRRQINSGGSTTSATSPSSTQKPTIVDGSFLG